MQIDAPISFFILFWVNPAQFFFYSVGLKEWSV